MLRFARGKFLWTSRGGNHAASGLFVSPQLPAMLRSCLAIGRSSSTSTIARLGCRPGPFRYRKVIEARPNIFASRCWSTTPCLRDETNAQDGQPESRSESASSETADDPADVPKASSAAESSADPVTAELEAKKREVLDWKDKYLRSVADFRNLQDRTAREVSSARDFAISRFARDLIESIDNLDRALATVPEPDQPVASADAAAETSTTSAAEKDSSRDLKNLYDGLRMTERILMQTLAKHGLERFDPSKTAERFDPNLHEATFMAPMPGKEDGTVFNTIQTGFKLNGRVIRAAKVGVVKNA